MWGRRIWYGTNVAVNVACFFLLQSRLTQAGEGHVVQSGHEGAEIIVGPLEEEWPRRVDDDPVDAVRVPTGLE